MMVVVVVVVVVEFCLGLDTFVLAPHA